MKAAGTTTRPRLVAKAVLRHDRVRDAEVLLLPERVVRLSPSSAAILARCDGSRTVAQIVDELLGEFTMRDDAEADRLATDVRAFIHDAAEHGWVEL